MSELRPHPQLEVALCLQRLVQEAEAGRLTGISFVVVTPDGLVPGWAGDYAGRRLAEVGQRRVVAVDDPFATTARVMGAER